MKSILTGIGLVLILAMVMVGCKTDPDTSHSILITRITPNLLAGGAAGGDNVINLRHNAIDNSVRIPVLRGESFWFATEDARDNITLRVHYQHEAPLTSTNEFTVSMAREFGDLIRVEATLGDGSNLTEYNFIVVERLEINPSFTIGLIPGGATNVTPGGTLNVRLNRVDLARRLPLSDFIWSVARTGGTNPQVAAGTVIQPDSIPPSFIRTLKLANNEPVTSATSGLNVVVKFGEEEKTLAVSVVAGAVQTVEAKLTVAPSLTTVANSTMTNFVTLTFNEAFPAIPVAQLNLSGFDAEGVTISSTAASGNEHRIFFTFVGVTGTRNVRLSFGNAYEIEWHNKTDQVTLSDPLLIALNATPQARTLDNATANGTANTTTTTQLTLTFSGVFPTLTASNITITNTTAAIRTVIPGTPTTIDNITWTVPVTGTWNDADAILIAVSATPHGFTVTGTQAIAALHKAP